jgi:predicted amidohydrolase YtcJ
VTSATIGQPAAHTANLAQGRPASASQSTSEEPPAHAVDGQADTVWSSGGHPLQWIEVDLGAAYVLERVLLRTAQTPAGAATHRVWGRAGNERLHQLGELSEETSDNQVLELASAPEWPVVRYLRIETTVSPSWVAWREIEVYGGPAIVTQPVADVILHNGNLLTMDDRQPAAQAIALSADKIVAVGSDAEILPLAGAATEVIDLAGLTVTPGFIDEHQHRLTDFGLFADEVGLTEPQAWIDDAIRHGWTGLHELFIDEGRMNNLRALDAAGELRLRVTGYLTANFHYDSSTWYERFSPPVIDSPYLQFPGVKITLDQEWGETIFFDQPTLNEIVRRADAAGWQIATHSFSLQANELLLRAYELALRGQSNTDRRHRLEHTGIISDDQLARMQRLGIIASVGLGGTPFMPQDESFQRSVPPEQWPWMVRTRDFLDAGIFTAGHTDTPWGSVDWRSGARPAHTGSVMWALHAAATRNDAYWPRPPEPWQSAQTISVDEAMHLLTINAAYTSFDEDRLGSLSPGKLADLVILSANPLDVPLNEVPQIEVLMTMIGGQVEFCRAGAEELCP